MDVRRARLLLVVLVAFPSAGASYQTPNFQVEAATAEVAEKVGEAAEHYRKELALVWLGQEMPRWNAPCPLQVKVILGRGGGATSFSYDGGKVLEQRMVVDGPLPCILTSVLPHEIAHTVFAHHFKRPLPRWADEGGAVLAENPDEIRRHELLIRQVLEKPGRAFPLHRLLALREYPGDVEALYAQGYSLTRFLVERRGRATFLAFVRDGMEADWDKAVKEHYRFANLNALEQAWLADVQNRPALTALAWAVVRAVSPLIADASRLRGGLDPEPRWAFYISTRITLWRLLAASRFGLSVRP